MGRCLIGVTWLPSPPNETFNYDLHDCTALSLSYSFLYPLHNSLHTRDKCIYTNLESSINLSMQSTHLVPT